MIRRGRWRAAARTAALIAAIAAPVATGCSNGAQGASGTGTASAGDAAGPTTTAAPSRRGAPTTVPTTPQGFARALYEAWTTGDRNGIQDVAEPIAVNVLFARPWSRKDGWGFSRCEGAAGSIFCMWVRPGERLVLRVRDGTTGLPLAVVSATFQPA